MRGIAGHPADTDRDMGFKRALAENPDITIAKETSPTGTSDRHHQINEIMASGTQFDGIWTSGIDNVIVDALKTANHLVPIVGADNGGFVKQLLTTSGPEGAAVTNPPAVGGAGVGWRADPRRPEAGRGERARHAGVWDNITDEGKASSRGPDPGLPDIWPLGLTIHDWTTYDERPVMACKGPGES